MGIDPKLKIDYPYNIRGYSLGMIIGSFSANTEFHTFFNFRETKDKLYYHHHNYNDYNLIIIIIIITYPIIIITYNNNYNLSS